MNAGNIYKSKRLQACLSALRSGPKTTMELVNITGSVAPHSDVAELRQEGFPVDCVYIGLSDAKRKVYEYRLL